MDHFETVGEPWMLEPDAAHLATLLREAADAGAEERERRGVAGALGRLTLRLGSRGRAVRRTRAIAGRPRPTPGGAPSATSTARRPSWRPRRGAATDDLAALLRAWTRAPAGACLYLLADPVDRRRAAALEARVMAAAAGIDLDACPDIAILREYAVPGRDAAPHAAAELYVPLHAAVRGPRAAWPAPRPRPRRAAASGWPPGPPPARPDAAIPARRPRPRLVRDAGLGRPDQQPPRARPAPVIDALRRGGRGPRHRARLRPDRGSCASASASSMRSSGVIVAAAWRPRRSAWSSARGRSRAGGARHGPLLLRPRPRLQRRHVAAGLLRIPRSTMFDYEWAKVQHNVNRRLAQAWSWRPPRPGAWSAMAARGKLRPTRA